MKIAKQRLKEIIREELSRTNEGGLAGHWTEPRHEARTPEERLINKLLIRSNIETADGDPQRAAEMFGLGDDEEVIAYLANLMGNPMYAPAGPEDEFGSLSEEENYGGRVPTYPELKRHPRKVAMEELNEAMDMIHRAYENEATREIAQQVVDELYRRFGRHEPAPEELEL